MWINVLIGAVLGAVAAIAISQVLKRTSLTAGLKGTIQTFGVTAIAILGVNLLGPYVNAQVEAARLEERLAEVPAYAAMKMHEPETYKRMISVMSESVKAGKSIPEAQAEGRAVLAELITKQLPIAGDSAVVDYFRVMVQEIRELHAGGDDACYTFLNPSTGSPFDITKRVSKTTMDADARALAALIQSAAVAPQPRVKMADYESSLIDLSDKMRGKFGDDVALLDQMQTALPAKRRVCQITAEMYDTIIAMPPDRSGKIIRALLSAGP